MSAELRVLPATTIVHLEINAGESVDHVLTVVDARGDPVPLASAVGVIAEQHGVVIHTWSQTVGNLSLSGPPGVVSLALSRADTLRLQRWGDAVWELRTVSTAGVHQRPCEGDVRINPTREPAT